MESMSNAPYYLRRGATPYGGVNLQDSIVVDGLTDVYNKCHMGVVGEKCAEKYSISRDQQDSFAIESYTRSQASEDFFNDQIFPITISSRKGDYIVDKDEEYNKVNFEKLKKLRTVFKKDGTITAGNASTINDGAAAIVLTTDLNCSSLGANPLARIIGFADAAMDPMDFPISPSVVIPKLLSQTGISKEKVALWELNEAFSVVGLVNTQLLDLDPSKVNVNGGAVSIGHPIGMSGCRIVLQLVYALKKGEIGVAAVCNGGGAASSIMIEKL